MILHSTKVATPRQLEVLETIALFQAEHRISPTVRELCELLGINSPNGVMCHLQQLEQKGYIERYPGISRGIVMTQRGQSTVSFAGYVGDESIPIKGRAPAGVPLEAFEDTSSTLNLAAKYGRDSFWLEVDGDSMIGAAIETGDMVLVQRCYEPAYDQIVVANIDGEVTVKRWRPVHGGVQLVPENPAHKPRFAEDASVIGAVKAILKTV